MPLALLSKIAFAGLFIAAGISHFLIPKFFLRIMPPWVPVQGIVNLVVGAVEILLGIRLLIPATQNQAAWGLIILLIVFFPANIYHFQQSIEKQKDFWPTLIRLPFQLVFIYWAYTFTT